MQPIWKKYWNQRWEPYGNQNQITTMPSHQVLLKASKCSPIFFQRKKTGQTCFIFEAQSCTWSKWYPSCLCNLVACWQPVRPLQEPPRDNTVTMHFAVGKGHRNIYIYICWITIFLIVEMAMHSLITNHLTHNNCRWYILDCWNHRNPCQWEVCMDDKPPTFMSEWNQLRITMFPPQGYHESWIVAWFNTNPKNG